MSPLHAAALEMDLHLPGVSSLKEKRSVVRPLVEGARRRFGVSAAEVGDQDVWRRSTLGFAAVAAEAGLADTLLRRVEEFVWSHPEVEVVRAELHWLGP